MVYYKKTITEVSMAKLRYLIRRLSVQAMLSYAKPTDQGTYSFSLTPAQTKSIIMGDAGGQRHFLSDHVRPPWQRI